MMCMAIFLFIGERAPFGDAETDFLERAASICAVKMLNERTAIQTEERMKGDLLEELFKGETDPANIIKRFSYFGYNMNKPNYVLTIEFPNQSLFLDILRKIPKVKANHARRY